MNVFNRTLTLVVLVSLAMGMGSAAILSSYGVISGTADVEGPTFYAAGGEKLLVNERPDDNSTYELENKEREFFETFDLEEGEWYPVSLGMHVKARLNETPEVDAANLQLEFRYDTDSGEKGICSDEVTVDSESYNIYSVSCTGSISGSTSGFIYKIEGTKDSAAYNVSASGKTRAELDVDETKVNAQ